MNQFDVPVQTPGTAPAPPIEMVQAGTPANAAQGTGWVVDARLLAELAAQHDELAGRVGALEEKLASYEAMIARAAESPMAQQVLGMLGVKLG